MMYKVKMGSDKKNKKNKKYFYFCPWLLRFSGYNILDIKIRSDKDENERIKNSIH